MKIIFLNRTASKIIIITISLILISIGYKLPGSAQDFRTERHRETLSPPDSHTPPSWRGHHVIRVGPATYYYVNGLFYTYSVSDFVVVAAPIGAVVPLLPSDATEINIKGKLYYTFAGVCYRKTPDGYIVIPEINPAKPDSSIAWEGDEVKVVVSVLNVRTGPGTENSIVKKVYQDDILIVQSLSSEWYFVKLQDGSFGWVMSKYTSLLKSRGVG